MKILHVNDVANVGFLLAKGQSEAGNDVNLLKLNIPFVRSHGFFKLLTFPLRIAYLLIKNQTIKAIAADIVHIHYANLGWLGIFGNYKYYLHCHGSDVRKGLMSPLKRIFIKKSIQKAKKVFYSTPDLEAVIKGVRKDIIFMPNPILIPENFKKNFSTGTKKVLLFSELNDDLKGTAIAIELLKNLRDNFKMEVHALIYGKDYNKYKNLDWINFHNKINRDNIYSFISGFDLILGQFSFGSLGVSEFEAMACGLPLVSFFKYKDAYEDSSGLPDTIDIRQLMDYTRLLIDNKELEETGQKNRKWVIKNHDYRLIAKRVLAEYEV